MRAAMSETFPEPNRRLLQRLVFFFGLTMGKHFYLRGYHAKQYILNIILSMINHMVSLIVYVTGTEHMSLSVVELERNFRWGQKSRT